MVMVDIDILNGAFKLTYITGGTAVYRIHSSPGISMDICYNNLQYIMRSFMKLAGYGYIYIYIWIVVN